MPRAPKKAKINTEPRVVLYPEVKVSLCVGEKSLTCQAAKDLLGWTVQPDDEDWSDSHTLKDHDGKLVRLTNNVTNRPYYSSLAATYKQEILNGRWRLNGETIIVGKTGLILDSQHRLIAFVLAHQEWEADPTTYGDEPTLPCIVVQGIDEDDTTVNTINTGKPRSLTDVIYRSEYFDRMKANDRKACARITDHAVKMLWHRTGADADAFAPRRTHSESLDFINRHMTLLKCVKHIYEEDGEDKRIAKYLSPGYAAALMYLMLYSGSETDKYHKDRQEKKLKKTHEDKAEEFWVLLASGADKLKAIRTSFSQLTDGGTLNEKLAILIKGWLLFADDKPLGKQIELRYSVDEESGIKTLLETPTVGGIDVGEPEEPDDEDDAPTPEEVESERRKIDQENGRELPPGEYAVGETVWVLDTGDIDASWKGKIVAIDGADVTLEVAAGFAGSGKTFPAHVDQLSRTKPII